MSVRSSATPYCVIGNPIAHSRSPDIHAYFAARTGQDMLYERCLAPIDGFAATVRQLIADGYGGASITVPFKLEAAALADRLTARAQAAGAVNTLLFGADGIVGDNTDGAGLVGDIVRNAGVSIAGKRVLVLGAGGAVRGAILPLLSERPGALVIANRTRATADALAAHFKGHADGHAGAHAGGHNVSACDFADIGAPGGEHAAPFDIVINGTSASLAGALPPVPAAAFAHGALAYDMMYGARPTPFMAFAAAHGALARDGLGMLVEQAAEAFFLWRGVRPATDEILARLRGAL